MKVTVCFGSVRVLVPCGAGDLLVRDLVREATHRYKKATGQVSRHINSYCGYFTRGFYCFYWLHRVCLPTELLILDWLVRS